MVMVKLGHKKFKIYTLICTRILNIFNFMPIFLQLLQITTNICMILSHLAIGAWEKNILYIMGVKHCQRLTFNVTIDYLNKTKLM